MKTFKLLDCTLRDGGYYTNWDFDIDLVNRYLETFNQLPVDYLEIGYRSNPMDEYFGEYFYCPAYVMDRIKSQTDKKLAIILNEKSVEVEDAQELLTSCRGRIDLIRIAIKPENFQSALRLGEKIKSLGFEVSFNVMYMSTWGEQKEFIELLPESKGIADYLYLVDSYGSVYPDDVRNTIETIREKTDINLGFHGHNNLELALINTLTAIEEGVDIVDATVTGMGRGAGNLKMELLLTSLDSKGLLELDYNSLTDLVNYFLEMQKEYGWGTSLPYIVAGANSLPQKNVMEWVTRRSYSLNSIVRKLSNESKGMIDNQKLPNLNFDGEKKYQSALIVGGGPSVVKHSAAIKEFLKKQRDLVVIHASSKNAMSFSDISNDQFFCLVGNEGHRLERVFGDVSKVNGKCILPAYPRKMGTYVPTPLQDRTYELKDVTVTDMHQDSHTALALQTAVDLGIEDIFVTGYDGYSGKSISEREQELFSENEYMFEKARQNSLNMRSITQSKYSYFIEDSVYSYL